MESFTLRGGSHSGGGFAASATVERTPSAGRPPHVVPPSLSAIDDCSRRRNGSPQAPGRAAPDDRFVTAAVGGAGRVRIALFGAGLVGQAAHAHLPLGGARALRARRARRSVGHRARGRRRRYGVPDAVADARGGLLGLGLDAIVIAVPDPAHRDVAATALAAGLHVLCEKPLALSLDEVRRASSRRATAGRVAPGRLHEALRPGVRAAARAPARRPGARSCYLSVEVNDPDQGPFVAHLLVAGPRRRRPS